MPRFQCVSEKNKSDGVSGRQRPSGTIRSMVPKRLDRTQNNLTCAQRVLKSSDDGGFDSSCCSPRNDDPVNGGNQSHPKSQKYCRPSELSFYCQIYPSGDWKISPSPPSVETFVFNICLEIHDLLIRNIPVMIYFSLLEGERRSLNFHKFGHQNGRDHDVRRVICRVVNYVWLCHLFLY